jgi:hypothetical protein
MGCKYRKIIRNMKKVRVKDVENDAGFARRSFSEGGG